MKKFLSIILAIAMLASLIPAVFATAAEGEAEGTLAAGDTIDYVFSHAAHTSTAGNGPAGGSVVGTEVINVGYDDIDPSVSSGAWGNKDHRETTEKQSNGMQSGVSIHRTGNFMYLTWFKATSNSEDGFFNWNSVAGTRGAPVVIISIDVPVAGTYIPSFDLAAPGDGQKFEVFAVKETSENKNLSSLEIRDSLDVADRLGAIDSSTGGTQALVEHYFQKGTYYLVFTPNGRGEKSNETVSGSEVILRMTAFHLTVPERVEVEEYDPSKLKLSSANKRYAKYVFETNSFNIANTVENSQTGETDWYFAENYASISAHATATNATIAADGSYSGYNTWTDRSDASKENNKFIRWTAQTSFSGTANYNNYAWFRSGSGKNCYLYFGYAPAWANDYGYINIANTDKWAFSAVGGSVTKSQIYTRVDNGIHMQIANGSLKEKGVGNEYMVLKINVPTAAKYEVNLRHQDKHANRTHAFAAYMLPASEDIPTTYAERQPHYVCGGNFNDAAATKVGTYNALKAGDYYLIIEFFKDENTSTTFAGAWDVDFYDLILYAQGEPEVKVDPELTAKREAMVLNVGNPEKETLDTASATVNVLARAVGTDASDDDIADVIETETVLAGGTYTTPEAPEIEGYTFLYWGRGLGTNMRPISTDATATIKAAKGANYIAAFYSKNDASDAIVEFYNANGDLVDRTRYEDGEEIEIPALPSLTGVGTSIGWTMDGGETVIGTDEVVEADGPIMAFFAVYDEAAVAKNIEITASGSTGITGAGTYAFGEKVTLVAPLRENGKDYNMFLYWKKGDEIVSLDREYEFLAAVSCNVEAVYAKYGPTTVEELRKVVLSNAGSNVVAEFVGCEEAIERGFIFGGTSIEDATYRQPMKTDSKSFTMTNDTSLIAKAYAIFTNGVIYSK